MVSVHAFLSGRNNFDCATGEVTGNLLTAHVFHSAHSMTRRSVNETYHRKHASSSRLHGSSRETASARQSRTLAGDQRRKGVAGDNRRAPGPPRSNALERRRGRETHEGKRAASCGDWQSGSDHRGLPKTLLQILF
jgi:hypothetical protein